MGDMDYRQLDPGIRETVRLLRSWGYQTVDSGDGESKPPELHTVDVGHVFIRTLATQLRLQALALRDRLRAHGYTRAEVEASYSTADDVAILVVLDVHDRDLEHVAKPLDGEEVDHG